MIKVRTITKEDKALAALALLNAGIKSRIKMLNHGFRVVFVGDWQIAAEVLNQNGFRFANGGPFYSANCFQDIDPNHGEVFVRYMEA
jgi:hypothetical protein